MAANRLEPIDLLDFTGGLNVRSDQFTLADNESPDMLNVDVDPRGGFYTRKGWRRWNDDEIGSYAAGSPWHPMNGFAHINADGSLTLFVVESDQIYALPDRSTSGALAGVVAGADPHGADFVSWGKDVYIACGMVNPSVRYEPTGTIVTLTGTTWSEVDAPTGNTMPRAEYAEAHAGYLFAACITEGVNTYFARVRWSHPNRPDAWRDTDYIDIDAEGGRITAIVSFLDHLLIFKSNSLWALYGYDEDSWQLIQLSASIGCPSITAVGWSETAVYFFSASNGGGVYVYTGSQPIYLSEKMRVALEQVEVYEQVCVSWANRRLFVSIPWHSTHGATLEPATLLVFDPDIGQGAWTQYRSDYGAVTQVIAGTDINTKFPVALFWSTNTAALVEIGAIDDAYDRLLQAGSLGTLPDGYLVTDTDAEILVTGDENTQQRFESYYRTRWLHGGWPDRRKSWRRPTFIRRGAPRRVDLLVQQFRDYDETTIRRTGFVPGVADDNSLWSADGSSTEGGIDWGGDATWGAAVQGASVVRSDPMGHAVAIQMKVLPSESTPMRKWGVDGCVIKFTVARFRT